MDTNPVHKSTFFLNLIYSVQRALLKKQNSSARNYYFYFLLTVSLLLDKIVDNVLACIYMLIAVLNFAGNSLTIAAIRKNPKLNTASNQFIYGLAIEELLVGLAIPYFALVHIIYIERDGSYETFALKSLLSKLPLFLSCLESMGHLVAISIDRCMSLVRPLQHKAFFTKKIAWKIMALIWAGSALTASVPLVSNRYELGDDVDCMLRTVKIEYYSFALAPMCAAFLLPVLVAYVRIYKIASSQSDNSKKPIIVIVIIVGCFAVCWTPFMILLGFILDVERAQNALLWRTFILSQVPPLLNSLINPLIYAWKVKDFRDAFLRIIRSACRCPQHSLDVPSNQTQTP